MTSLAQRLVSSVSNANDVSSGTARVNAASEIEDSRIQSLQVSIQSVDLTIRDNRTEIDLLNNVKSDTVEQKQCNNSTKQVDKQQVIKNLQQEAQSLQSTKTQMVQELAAAKAEYMNNVKNTVNSGASLEELQNTAKANREGNQQRKESVFWNEGNFLDKLAAKYEGIEVKDDKQADQNAILTKTRREARQYQDQGDQLWRQRVDASMRELIEEQDQRLSGTTAS